MGIHTDIRALADIPLIGSVIEEYVNNEEDVNNKEAPLDDYKTVVGQTVTDNGIKVRLNEVLLDEGRLVISSTFQSNEIKLDNIFLPFPDVYINGKEVNGGGGGGREKKQNDSTYTFFTAVNLGTVNTRGDLDIEIVYRNISMHNKQSVKGTWRFAFTTSGDKLLPETKEIPINQSFALENGQQIKVQNLKVTPISTKLNYQMMNGTQFDVLFRIEDQNGKEVKRVSGHTLAENSHIRFETLNDYVGTLKITPYVISGEEGEKKTDDYKVLHDRVIEVEVK